MRKIYLILLAAGCTMSLAAQNWTGAVNADWNNAANWTSAPSTGDDIVLDPVNYTGAMAEPVISANSNFTPAEILIQNGAHLTIGAVLSASDRVEVVGEGTRVTINNGSFNVNGSGNNARLIFVDGAHFQMESGILTVGQRLLFELGATGEINGGSITVGETIALVDGNTNRSSQLVQNGGTITTNGEFGFENEVGQFYPTFKQTNGTLHINGDLLWLGVAPGTGRGYFKISGGIVRVTGDIMNDPASTMGMHIEISENGRFRNQGASVRLLASDTITLLDGGKWRDSTTTTWQNNGVFYSADNTIFHAQNTTITGSGLYQFDYLHLSGNFNHVSPSQIFVSSHINTTQSGSFNHNANKLILNGFLYQRLMTSIGNFNFYDLEINNTAHPNASFGDRHVLFYDNVTIAHSLNLIDGIVSVYAPYKLKLTANATIIGGSESSFIDGIVQKTGNTAFTFHVGEYPNRYRPLAIDAPADIASVVEVDYNYGRFSNTSPMEAPLEFISHAEYWDLKTIGVSSPIKPSISWNNASQSGLWDCGNITLGVWDNTQWRHVPSTVAGLCNGSASGSLSSDNALPVIGPITIGYIEPVNLNEVSLCPGDSVVIGDSTYKYANVYVNTLTDVSSNDSVVVTIVENIPTLWASINYSTSSLSVNSLNQVDEYQWIDCDHGNAFIPGATSQTYFPTVTGNYAVIVRRNYCGDTAISYCHFIEIDSVIVNPPFSVIEHDLPEVKLYPNPIVGGGQLRVSSSLEINRYEIRSIEGRLLSLPSNFSYTEEEDVVQLPSLSSGIYLLVSHHTDGSASTKRFVVVEY
jgi:hypothetical protein